jgi:hypothetical protein
MRAQTYAFSLLATYFFARGATVPFPHPLLLESVSIRQGKWERVHAFFCNPSLPLLLFFEFPILWYVNHGLI